MANVTSSSVFFALLGGLLPALLWLWFWLKEDPKPEPRRVLIPTFLAGMIMAVLALFLEQISQFLIKKSLADLSPGLTIVVLLLIWAGIEETAKYIAARKIALSQSSFDEPVDALIYLITAALGFAAFENILFLLKVIGTQGTLVGLITGNLRFLGATLLHSLCSAVVGASIAFSFFHKEKMVRNILGGLVLATILHTSFNFFIIESGGANLFKIFIPLWLAVIVIFLIFEKVKKLKENRIKN